MTTHHGRNEPCPCGSGRKYKNCCEGKLALTSRVKSGGPWLWVTIAAGVIVIALFVFMRPRNPVAGTPGAAAPGAPGPSTNAGGSVAAAPWAYDPATNRHFDPGHNHWHDGPPPPASARGTTASAPITPSAPGAMPPGLSASPIVPSPTPSGVAASPAAPGATPAPWTYDAAKNQHWDPTHNHWHQGPPPQQPR